MLIGGSILAALLVLVLAWQVETPQPATPNAGPATQSRDTSLPDATAPPSESGEGVSDRVRQSRQGRMLRVTEDRRTLLTYDDIDPKPQGVFDVTRPDARIFFSPQRVMTIEADQGTIVAPGNQPREGDFQGHVIVTLYRSEDGQPVSLKGLGDIAVRVYLERAQFDLELGRLHSDGPVHLTGRTVDFRGRELLLKFNELHNRLQRLKITHGQVLRFRQAPAQSKPDSSTQPDKQADAAQAGPGPSPMTTPPETEQTAQASADQAAASPEPTESTNEPAEASADDSPQPASESSETSEAAPAKTRPSGPQFYRARFHEQVRIEAPERSVTMRGDVLDAVFAMQGNSPFGGSDAQAKKPQPSPAGTKAQQHRRVGSAKRVGRQLASAGPSSAVLAALARVQHGQTQPAGTQPRTLAFGEPMMQPAESDVTVRWTGPLVVEPEPDPPSGLAGAEDAYMQLTGTPARVRQADRGHLEAARLSYLTQSGRLRAQGQDGAPLVVQQRRQSRLTGQTLQLNPAEQSGYVIGPGTLITEGAGTDEPAQGPAPDSEPDSLTVRWQDRLDLAFTPQPDEPTASADPASAGPDQAGRLGELGRLEAARFQGQVRTEHPRFQLGSNTLAVRFTADPDHGNRPSAIEAAGDVQLDTEPRQGQPPSTLTAQRLHLALAADYRGRLKPTAMQARQAVRLKRPDLELTAEQFDAALAPQLVKPIWRPAFTDPLLPRQLPPQAADSPQAPVMASPGATVDGGSSGEPLTNLQRFTARQQVHLTTTQPELDMTGRRLEVLPDPNRLTLWGHPGQPAVMRQPKGELSGQRIHINRAAESVDVPEAGQLDYRLAEEGGGNRLRAQWSKSMQYDRRAGQAKLRGAVSARTESAKEKTHLRAQALDLYFADKPTSEDDAQAEASTQKRSSSDNDEPAEPRYPWSPPLARDKASRSANGSAANANQTDQANQADGESASQAQAAATQDAPAAMLQGDQRLTRLEARDDVIFTATSRETNDRGQPHTRLRLEGQTLRFLRQRDRVLVPGDGRMLIEDHRPDEAATQPAETQQAEGEDQPAENAGGDEAGVDFAGRGETLFVWDGQLTLDAAKSDMLIQRDVWMVHRPSGPSPQVTLDCERLLADMSEAGGMGIWLSDQAPDTELQQVQADRNVRLQRAGRTIEADHLKYTASDRRVQFWSGGDRAVLMSQDDQPTAMRARRVQWFLRSNTFEASGVQGGSAPIPPSQ
jgi:hypothetical protein